MNTNEIKNFFYYENGRDLTKEEEDKINKFNRVISSIEGYSVKALIPLGEHVIKISRSDLDMIPKKNSKYKKDKPVFRIVTYSDGKIYLNDTTIENIRKTIQLANIHNFNLFGESEEDRVFTFEELKQFIFNKLFESNSQELEDMGFSSQQIEALFDEEIDERRGDEVGQLIVFVKRVGNTRLSVIERGTYYGSKYSIRKFIPDDKQFNWIDKGNVYWNGKYFAFDLNKYLKDKDYYFINEVKIKVNHFKGIGITETDFKKIIKEIKQNRKQKELVNEQEDLIYKALRDRIKSNDFELKGWKFKDDKISNNDFSIGIKGVKISKYLTSSNLENMDINNIWSNIISKVTNDDSIYFKIPISLYSGKYELTIDKLTSNNGMNYWYIDGIRVSKKDLEQALEHGTCFDKKEDYYDFLKSIRKIPFRARDLISQGLFIRIGEVFFKFSVSREGKHWFISTKSHKIKIEGGFNNILRIPSSRGSNRFYSEWKLFDYFVNNFKISKEYILDMLKESKKEYEKALAKAEQLLEETIKNNKERIEKLEVKVKPDDYSDDEKTQKGFKVKGKLKDYFVTNDLKVYEYPNLRYVCVVDRTGSDLSKNDKLVARLYSLMNDSLLVDKIYTLKN